MKNMPTAARDLSMIRLPFVLSIALAASAFAQPALDDTRTLKIPLLGYVASGSPTGVRPLAGVPGAVVAGAAITFPDGVSRVIPGPGGAFAFVEVTGASQLGIVQLSLTGPGDVQTLSNTFPHADLTAFSPSGNVAAIYSTDLHQALVVTGLPSSAATDRIVDLSSTGLPVTSLAISDDAQMLLAGVSDGTSGAIWAFANGQDPVVVAAAGAPSALRFFGGSQSAAVADRAWQQVSILSSFTGGASLQAVAGPGQGLSAPADVEISPDQQFLWVADASGQLLSINISSSAVTSMASPVSEKLTRLAGRSVYLVTSGDGANAGVWAPEALSGIVWRIPVADKQ